MRRKLTLVTVTAVAILAFAGTAWGEEEKLDPLGEIHVTANVPYVKVFVNDAAWESVEYQSGGKVAMIKGLRMENGPFRVRLVDSQDTHEDYEFTVEEKAFKRKIKKRYLFLLVTKKVRLQKKPEDPNRDDGAPNEPDAPPPAPAPDEGDDL